MPVWFFLEGVCFGVFWTDEFREDWAEPAADTAREFAWELALELLSEE